ncbi:DUF418 domain-containing protein [Streptomyces sp. NPDC055210]
MTAAENIHKYRIREIDALRGFALFGICMANAPTIAGVDYSAVSSNGTLADQVAVWLVTVFFSAKFYLLFSFLFGYSFTFQVPSATVYGDAHVSRFLRRVAGMLLLGLVHASLFYSGDILSTYAVLGTGLLALRNISVRNALRTAASLLGLLMLTFLTVGIYVLSLDPVALSSPREGPSELSEAYLASPVSIVSMNICIYQDNLGGTAVYSLHVLSALLVGFSAGKCGLFSHPYRTSRRVKRALLICTLSGISGAVFAAACTYGSPERDLYYIGQAVSLLTSPALAAVYAYAVIRLHRMRYGTSILRAFGAAGKMSLSNYLAQSIALSVIFTGYGFGLYGEIGPAVLCMVCLALYLCQLSYSSWLMQRTRYGPAEAVLRRITLGRKEFNAAKNS